MAWSLADVPDMSGTVAVVTGGNGGLGLETVRALAGAGAHVVMAARDQGKAAAARSDVLGTHPSASLEVVELDLASLASVEQAATAVTGAHDRVDVLVNNAGLMAMPERRTEDGFEMQFGVNHLGHWAFTAHLLESLLRAPAARVVTVTSTAHHLGRVVDPENPHLRGRYGAWKAYGQSKLANLHFAVGLQREFDRVGTPAQSLAAHPGLTDSDLQTRTHQEGGAGIAGRLSVVLAQRTGMSVQDGALPQIRAAVDRSLSGGDFVVPLWVSTGPPVVKPLVRRWDLDRGIANLWTVSERETGVDLDVDGALAAARAAS